ncbi:hypothetical protein [Streptomyces sp. S186]|uniref:hypothetical protein n=1 Tax=Streptomyces sp. S186 TaxID=3434395 RepID=UPI003F6814F5
MHKFRKAAAVVAVIGSVSLLGSGTAYAQGMGEHGGCHNHELNIDILGEVGILNGLLANLINGEGSPGGQGTSMGNCGK